MCNSYDILMSHSTSVHGIKKPGAENSDAQDSAYRTKRTSKQRLGAKVSILSEHL